MKTQLTVKESAKLIELGVSPERASMCLLNLDYDSEVIPCEDVWEENGRLLANVNDEVIDVDRQIVTKDSGFDHSYANDNPIFTIADILDILPKEFNVSGTSVRLHMYNHPAEYWIASYVTYDGGTLTYQNPCSAEKELIDALYSLLVWCLEKGYVK